MAADAKWYFTKEQLANSPSRRCGIDADKELSYRQQAANFIQDMGQRLSVTQLCINTAIVYMHRFYVFHSLTQFPRNKIAAAALFLAAKTEEQPRKLEHVIRCAHMCLHRESSTFDVKSEQYIEQANELVANESALLMTLGFELAIDHPHTHVVRCCHLVKAHKDLAQTSYFMASNSLHLTTMCLQYKPTVVACFCIHLTCKWSNWEIPLSMDGKQWFWYIDPTVTSELLQKLTQEFLHIFDKCPSRLKKKIRSMNDSQSSNMSQSISSSSFEFEPRRIQSSGSDGGNTTSLARPHHQIKNEEKKVPLPGRSTTDHHDYREKKEREKVNAVISSTPSLPLTSSSLSTSSSSTSSSSTLSSSSSSLSSSLSSSSLPLSNKQGNLHEIKHTDLKLHPPHNKPNPGVNLSNRQSTPNQKSVLHQNLNQRSDIKMNQATLHRHSSSTQLKDPNRDPNKHRDSNLSAPTGGGVSTFLHPNINQRVPIADAMHTDLSSRLDSSGLYQEGSSHFNSQNKMSNNNFDVHRGTSLHDKRYDSRHKLQEYKKDEQNIHPEYRDIRFDRQRKSDSLEQRSEEVRKLIEKTIPPPKPKTDTPKGDLVAHTSKLLYHSKYNQIDKSHEITESTFPITSNLLLTQHNLSPSKTQSHQQHSTHGMSQWVKDSSKNGNSQSTFPMANIEDSKAEKKLQYEDDRCNVPVVKSRSLFSPENLPKDATREFNQRSKSRQKTPPSAKFSKQPALDLSATLISPLSSPVNSQEQETLKRLPVSESDYPYKQHRATNDLTQLSKSQDAISSILKTTETIPELLQPISDISHMNVPIINETKKSDVVTPAETEQNLSNQTCFESLTNGVDINSVRQAMSQTHNFTNSQDSVESGISRNDLLKANNFKNNLDYKTVAMNLPRATVELQRLSDFPRKEIVSNKSTSLNSESEADFPKQILNELAIAPVKNLNLSKEELKPPSMEIKREIKTEILEEFSRTKSAESISALLQESLAPMPSLLHQYQQKIEPKLPPTPTAIEQSITETINQEAPLTSTVDVSAISGPSLNPTSFNIPPQLPLFPAPIVDNKSEHHKSEKKKKEKKHKHKEKNKEKHKHKHKDKDRHRDKERKKADVHETIPTEPIKITIPKDKINLLGSGGGGGGGGGESLASDDKLKSPPGKIRIKIPKERIKGAEAITVPSIQPVQAPLKIKIRTDALSRNSSGTLHESRKRERSDGHDSSLIITPPVKKLQQINNPDFVQQRFKERQNGRHHNSSNNVKERHSSSHKSAHKLSQQST